MYSLRESRRQVILCSRPVSAGRISWPSQETWICPCTASRLPSSLGGQRAGSLSLSPALASSAQVGCMRQVLRAGALGSPRGMGWGGRRERGSGWGTHVNPWLIHVSVWQKLLQYCKVISLQLIKINEKKKKEALF